MVPYKFLKEISLENVFTASPYSTIYLHCWLGALQLQEMANVVSR